MGPRRRYAGPSTCIKMRAGPAFPTQDRRQVRQVARALHDVRRMAALRLLRPDDVGPAETGSSGSHRRTWFAWLATLTIGLALAGVTLGWWWVAGAERRDLQALPDAQRLALYRSTVDNLKSLCDPAPPLSLRDFCRRQAELALELPECDRDGACRVLARRHLAQPRR